MERPTPERLTWLLANDKGTNKGYSSLAAEVRELRATLERVEALARDWRGRRLWCADDVEMALKGEL